MKFTKRQLYSLAAFKKAAHGSAGAFNKALPGISHAARHISKHTGGEMSDISGAVAQGASHAREALNLLSNK